MLYLIQSNRMEVLAQQLCHALSQHPGHALAPQTVLVQSPGMAQWLKLHIAEQNGIAANLHFPLPSSFIWELYRQHVPDLPAESPFTKSNMVWKLMTVLPNLLSESAFAPLQHYLEGGQSLRLYQLCQKIADVFDQYLVYRPQWILAWENNDVSQPGSMSAQHHWQPVLWRALLDYAESLQQPPLHRANLHARLLEALMTADAPEQSVPLHVFGLSAMPTQQLEVFQALAHTQDIFLYWANPSEEYWGDLVDEATRTKVALSGQDTLHRLMDVGNPLLSSWGKMGRDYLDMLIDTQCEVRDLFEAPQPGNMLSRVHAEIYQLEHRGSGNALSSEELFSNGVQFPKYPVAQEDRSIRVSACHSRLRELETLQDHLLSLFDSDSTVRPGDIVVMMPDIGEYAALVEGVFGSAEENEFIPYAISDRSSADISPLMAIIPQVFSLHQSRLTAAEILGILEVPAVMRKFDMQPQDLTHIGRWLEDVGVRWGWDARDKQRWDLPPEGQNTLKFGLDRLLAGYAILPGDTRVEQFDGIAPYADMEGQQALALGKLVLFSGVLSRMLNWCQQSGSLEDKVQQAFVLLDALFEPDEADHVHLTKLRQGLSDLAAQSAQYRADISQDVLLCEVQQLLGEKGVSQRFLAGAVNFCTLMPMRSIPFKHVCILGLNDEDYPRDTVPVGFDLMRHAPAQKGDRARQQDDRYLFLEAILAARSSLYLSFQGASARDNSERVPSVLLSELLEYLQQTFCLEGDSQLSESATADRLLNHLLDEAPLQPFSPSLFDGQLRPASFHKHWFTVASGATQAPAMTPFWQVALSQYEREVEQIQLASLIAFCSNPAKALFRERWHTSLDIHLGEQQHSEPFLLDGLARFQLFDQLMSSPDTPYSAMRAEGVLPYANLGKVHFQQSLETLGKMRDALVAISGGASPRRQEIDIVQADWQLQGWLDQVMGHNLIFARPGAVRGKDRLALWLSWLALCAGDGHSQYQNAYYVGLKETVTLPPVEREAALAQLSVFAQFYQQGLSEYQHFYPESGWQWLKTGDKNRTLQTFNGNAFAGGEGQDVHIHRMCPDLSAHFDQFVEITERLLAPLYAWERG